MPSDLQSAAVWLAADVEQHRVDSVCGHDVEDGLGTALDSSDIFQRRGMTVHDRHSEILDILSTTEATVRDGQVQMMVLLVHSGGFNQIVADQRIGDLR